MKSFLGLVIFVGACKQVAHASLEALTQDLGEDLALLPNAFELAGVEPPEPSKQPVLDPYCFEFVPEKRAFKAVNCSAKNRALQSWSTVDGIAPMFKRAAESREAQDRVLGDTITDNYNIYSSGEAVTTRACTVAIVGFLWGCVSLFMLYLMLNPHEEFQSNGLDVLRLNSWPYDANEPPTVFGSYVASLPIFVWASVCFVSCGGGAIIVVICEVKMLRYLCASGGTLTANTRRLLEEFNRALLAMAICPLMTSGLPVFFFVITTVLSLTPGSISAFVTTALSSIAVLNPLTTIFFMRCYRDVVLGRFKKNRSNRIMGEGAVTGIELTDAVAN